MPDRRPFTDADTGPVRAEAARAADRHGVLRAAAPDSERTGA
jgi:hypothetical protein